MIDDLAQQLRPIVWSLLGYPFDAGPMLAALAACFLVRLRQCLESRAADLRRRALHVVVTALALLFSAAWIVVERPSPFYALLGGAGFGALGSGIIAIALTWVRRLEPLATFARGTPQPRRRQRPQRERRR